MPNIGDVIELTKGIKNLRPGMQGTIVHCHSGEVYEVEFTNEDGETLELSALNSEQFIVVWQAETRKWIPVEQQAIELISRLPHDAVEEVLDFVHFLSFRDRKRLSY
jgi:hypothetical protein